MTLTFGAAPCLLPGVSATGIGLSFVNGNGQRQLIVAGVPSNRASGTALIGAR